MAHPSNASVTIDGENFNAMSAHVGVETQHNDFGLPMMGTLRTVINCLVDIHDNKNLPFATLKKLYDLADGVTRDKIKDIKIEFWQDDSRTDAICVYSFRGWISAFHISGGGGVNHILNITLQPELDQKQFVKLVMSN